MGYISFLPKIDIHIFLPRRNTLFYSSQVEYRVSNQCFQTHQHISSLLPVYLDGVASVCVEVDYQKQQTYCLRVHYLDFAIQRIRLLYW